MKIKIGANNVSHTKIGFHTVFKKYKYGTVDFSKDLQPVGV